MRFEPYPNIDMSSLQGHVKTTYNKLVEVFGEPHYRGDGKVTCEWNLRFVDGTIATIYDYKCDETPMGEYEWHIGGYNNFAVKRVTELLK